MIEQFSQRWFQGCAAVEPGPSLNIVESLLHTWASLLTIVIRISPRWYFFCKYCFSNAQIFTAGWDSSSSRHYTCRALHSVCLCPYFIRVCPYFIRLCPYFVRLCLLFYPSATNPQACIGLEEIVEMQWSINCHVCRGSDRVAVWQTSSGSGRVAHKQWQTCSGSARVAEIQWQ